MQEPRRLRIGDGRISGYLSILLGLLSLGAVICFHFPEVFTTPEFRVHYPIGLLRWVLFGCLAFSFGFALASLLLRRKLGLALVGMLISATAILLGGTSVEIHEFEQSLVTLSLDWLLLDILVLSAIFIPLELFYPKRLHQTKFHLEWKTDLAYFAVSHLFVLYIAVIIKAPAVTLFGDLGLEPIQSEMQSLPFLVAAPLAMLVADLVQYGAHRAFHSFAFLWRFHSVHHSIRTVDWIAGSRLHLVDILVVRALSYIPLYVLGFSMPVLYAYVAIVALQAVGVHANTRLEFGWLKHVVVTPQYHHWHHSDDPRDYNKNYAIHFPWIDRIFGTHYLPGEEWPESMGLKDKRFPKGFFRQLIHPFRSDARTAEIRDPSCR